MQINRTGYSLLALLLARRARSSPARVLVFPFPILIGPIWVWSQWGSGCTRSGRRASGRHEQWLWKTGVKGKGTLVSASSGVLINDQPLMKLELDLEVPGQPPRRVTRKLIISDFAAHLMEPGLVLPVYVNPQDPDDILVVW